MRVLDLLNGKNELISTGSDADRDRRYVRPEPDPEPNPGFYKPTRACGSFGRRGEAARGVGLVSEDGAFRSIAFGACGEAPRARREGPRETLPRSRINGGSRIYVNVCVPFALWLVARNPDGPRAGDRSRSGKASPTAF